MPRLVLLSDTHSLHRGDVVEGVARPLVVPDGDILIFAGDLCNSGTLPEVADFGRWLRSLPHRYKVVIAGNHDFPFEHFREQAVDELFGAGDGGGIVYLQDSQITLMGLRIYGSPWQPRFFDWAFNLDRNGPELAEKWAMIPEGLDVLVTHGPPYGVLDETHFGLRRMGCELLAAAVVMKQPRLHVFGHNHGGYGKRGGPDGTIFVNAAICDDRYAPIREPIVIDLAVRDTLTLEEFTAEARQQAPHG